MDMADGKIANAVREKLFSPRMRYDVIIGYHGFAVSMVLNLLRVFVLAIGLIISSKYYTVAVTVT
jgi:hypothetical protein